MSVHTYTHSREERRSQQRPTFSLLPPAAEKAAEGDLIPRVLKEGAPRRGEKMERTSPDLGVGCFDFTSEACSIKKTRSWAEWQLGKIEECVWRRIKLPVKLRPLGHAMLCGRLTQGCLGLQTASQEMMQVWIVTWNPEAQTGIRLGWRRGETRCPRCC